LRPRRPIFFDIVLLQGSTHKGATGHTHAPASTRMVFLASEGPLVK
jgi:hypothetical protein